jgi:PhoPQ-activated pathogenicity-related protein
MPKLVINTGGDEFFLPDDNYYFWDDLPEPKFLRLVLTSIYSS